MAGTNDFLPFGTAGGADVLDQASYAALAARTAGFTTGTAVSTQLNKVWRQSSFVAACVAQIIANNNVNAPDDGNVSTFVTNLLAALFKSPALTGSPSTAPITVTAAGGDSGGRVVLKAGATNAQLSGDIIFENYIKGARFFESAGAGRGIFFDLSTAAAGASSTAWHSGNFDPNAKANLASPNLSGVPTAPTAAVGTNTNQLATMASLIQALSSYLTTSAAAATYLTPAGGDARYNTPISNAQSTANTAQSTANAANTAAVNALSVANAAAASEFGIGQTWQNVSAGRAANTTYTNGTARPIQVSVNVTMGTSGFAVFTVNGVANIGYISNILASSQTMSTTCTVPPGQTYSLTTNSGISQWTELR